MSSAVLSGSLSVNILSARYINSPSVMHSRIFAIMKMSEELHDRHAAHLMTMEGNVL